MPRRGTRHQRKSFAERVFATWPYRIVPLKDTPIFRLLCGEWKTFHVALRDRHNALNLRGREELVQAVRKRTMATTGPVSDLVWKRGHSRLGQTETNGQ